MAQNNVSEKMFPTCPIRNILSRVSDKWSMLIIYTLNGHGVLRFKALQRELPDISQKMLTQTLRTLVEDGYVRRVAYAEVPPRVEYSLTDRARSLLPHLEALTSWAASNMDAIMRDRKRMTKAAWRKRV